NVTGIIGFGAACEIAQQELPEEAARLTDLRGRLQAGLFERLDEMYLNGHPTERPPGNLNLSFSSVWGEWRFGRRNDGGGQLGLGMHLGHAGAVLCHPGAGRE